MEPVCAKLQFPLCKRLYQRPSVPVNWLYDLAHGGAPNKSMNLAVGLGSLQITVHGELASQVLCDRTCVRPMIWSSNKSQRFYDLR